MEIDVINEMAEYDYKYLKETIQLIREIDIDNMEINTLYNTFKITTFALNQLLFKLNIKTIYYNIKEKFKEEKCTGLWEFLPNKGRFIMGFDEFRSKVDESMNLDDKLKSIWEEMYKRDFGYRKQQEMLFDIVELGKRQFGKGDFKFIYDSNENIIKGVVSKKYKYTPNKHVLDASKEFYGETIDERFSFYDDERGMNLFYKENDVNQVYDEKIVFGNNINNGQFGGISLSVSQNATFLSCTNGLKLDDIKGVKKSIYHNSKEIIPKFKQYIKKSVKRSVLLNIIKSWIDKPIMFKQDQLKSEDTIKKLGVLLQRFGVSNKEYRNSIIEVIKKEDKDINAFSIGSAVNYFASNVLNDSYESYSLLNPAYHIMAIQ